MPDQGFIVTPTTTLIDVALEPAHNVLHSLMLLAQSEHASGFGEWVARTAAALSATERETVQLVTIGLHYATVPQRSWPSFPAYVDHLAAMEPLALRDKLLDTYSSILPLSEQGFQGMSAQPLPVDKEAILADVDAYLAFLRERFEADHMDEALEAKAYTYVIDPPAMQALIVSHLREMWSRYLAPEWERVEPMLQDAVRAFQQVDLASMGVPGAIEYVTGQEFEGDKWSCVLRQATHVTFVPSAHVGPYVGRYGIGCERAWILFGARLPKGIPIHAPDLDRNEILVRLNALADDNRLRILKFVSEQGEQCSSEIMEELELSQSTASRHLNQLTAAGYLSSRRVDGAKCYQLHQERIEETLQAISAYLLSS
jgi:DNA-binding transcriptional ArsR family regulator